MDVTTAFKQLALLDGVLILSFIAAVLAVYALYHVSGRVYCQVCLAVASVWVLNLFLEILPPWVTVFLMGQSVAGGAAMGRDLIATRWVPNNLPDRRRRLAKQFTYFSLITSGTLLAAILLVLVLGNPPL